MNKMAEYIDRQAVIDALGKRPMAWTDNGYDLGCVAQYDLSRLAIETVPSADVPQIVRCRDCKWFGKIGCAINIVDESDKPHEDDFCSFGEIKDGEQNETD